MTLQEAIKHLLGRGTIELSGDLVVVRLPGKTGKAKHSSLMRVVAGFRTCGEGSDPRNWTLAMGGSVLLGRRLDVLCFLDGSTQIIPSSWESYNLRNRPHSAPMETSQ